MSKVKVRSVYEQVEKGIFVEGFAYTSEEKDSYDIAVAFAGVQRGAFYEVKYVVKKRIEEIQNESIPLFVDYPEMVEMFQNDVKKLQSMVDAFERLGL
jgi:hypothetical protein